MQFLLKKSNPTQLRLVFFKILIFFKKYLWRIKSKKFYPLIFISALNNFNLSYETFSFFLYKFITLIPRKIHKDVFKFFEKNPTVSISPVFGRISIIKGKVSWKALSRKKKNKKTRGIGSITKFNYLTTLFSTSLRTITGNVNASVNLFF